MQRGHVGLERSVGEDAEGERRLTHGRTSADNDQVVGLQTGEAVVEVVVAGGDTGDGFAPLVEQFEFVERVGEQLLHRGHVFGELVLVDLEHERLGSVDDRRHVVGQ